jgi:hypothetical protein
MGIPPALSFLAPLAPGNCQIQALKDEKTVFLQCNNVINHNSVKYLFRHVGCACAASPAPQAGLPNA